MYTILYKNRLNCERNKLCVSAKDVSGAEKRFWEFIKASNLREYDYIITKIVNS